MLSVLLLFSACGLTKEYKHTANYAERMNSVAKQYDYKIQNISKSTDTYSFEMKNDKQLVELSFELRNEDQYNSFEFICINPKDYSFILKIVNEVSRKKFSEDKFYNVINNEDDFYNLDDDGNCKRNSYLFYKIEYIGISEDYCIQYYSYNVGEEILVLSGFTK